MGSENKKHRPPAASEQPETSGPLPEAPVAFQTSEGLEPVQLG